MITSYREVISCFNRYITYCRNNMGLKEISMIDRKMIARKYNIVYFQTLPCTQINVRSYCYILRHL